MRRKYMLELPLDMDLKVSVIDNLLLERIQRPQIRDCNIKVLKTFIQNRDWDLCVSSRLIDPTILVVVHVHMSVEDDGNGYIVAEAESLRCK